MVCVEELPRFPASIDEVAEALSDEEAGVFDKVVAAAKAQAAAKDVAFQPHVVVGHPVAAIVEFIQRGGYDLLVVGYMGHSALYNRSHRQHDRSAGRACAVPGVGCEMSSFRSWSPPNRAEANRRRSSGALTTRPWAPRLFRLWAMEFAFNRPCG